MYFCMFETSSPCSDTGIEPDMIIIDVTFNNRKPRHPSQGKFPKENTLEDGYKTTAPVGSYPGNNYQVHDLIGNVWEWVEDWWTTQHSPQGAPLPTGQEKVKKGGSFMCTKQYCYRYRCPARTKTSADTTGLNVGFRCVK